MKKSKKALTFTAAVMTAAMLSACHETVYGPPPEALYGPPEDFEQSVVIETTTPSYDPSKEEPEDVYGPPPEPEEEEIPEPVYGPPADSGEEIPETVYGPPSENG